MSQAEQFRVLLLLSTVVFTYLFAAGFLVLSFRWRKRPNWLPRWFRNARAAVFSLAILGICCIAYGYFVEPYWPEVTRVRIPVRQLPPGAGPIRFVHISDVHSDPKRRLEGRLPELIGRETPHFIVFTGDTINSPAGLENARYLFKRLAEIAPTYAARGNWDVWYWSDIDLFAGTGVHTLNEDIRHFEVGGIPVNVVGVAVEHHRKIPDLLASLPAEEINIFLHHYPDEIEMVAPSGKVDIYCAGHIHGGQVAIPVYGALVTLSRLGKKYERGLYEVGRTRLYVNRGIGMEGGPAPRVRFWSRPEITVIELVPLGT